MRKLVAFLAIVAFATPALASPRKWKQIEPELQRITATVATEVVTGISKGNDRSNRPSVDKAAVGDIVAGFLTTALTTYQPTESFDSYQTAFEDLQSNVLQFMHDSEKGITWDVDENGKHKSIKKEDQKIEPTFQRALHACRAVTFRSMHVLRLHLETHYPELLTGRNPQVRVAKAMAAGIKQLHDQNITLMSTDSPVKAADLVKREQRVKQKEENVKRMMEDLMRREQSLMEREGRVSHREWVLQREEKIANRERIVASREDRVKRREESLKAKEEVSKPKGEPKKDRDAKPKRQRQRSSKSD